MVPSGALACGNGYGANYTNCGTQTYSRSYSSSYSNGGSVDVGAIAKGTATMLELAPKLMNTLGEMGSKAANSVSSATTALPGLSGASQQEQPSRRRLSDDEATDCAGMRARLKPHAPNEDWIRDQMARSGCLPDGRRMALRDRLKRELDKPKFDDEPPQILGGILNGGAPYPKPSRTRESDITGIGGR